MTIKILVIEDEPAVRDNIQEILKLEDYDVITASNGKVGLELARTHLPALIVCDVMMPELDGYGVLIGLRQDPTTIAIPLIFLTAKATKSDLRKGMELGADDYLTKPFTPAELRQAIASRRAKQAQLLSRYQQARIEAAATLPVPAKPLSPVPAPAPTDRLRVIHPTGILDISNGIQLRREIGELMETGARTIIIECQDVGFIDSPALATLVLAFQNVHESGGRLVLCGINQQLQLLLELSSMDSVFEIFSSTQDFLVSQSSRPAISAA
jgi:anti-anti-sigma factor